MGSWPSGAATIYPHLFGDRIYMGAIYLGGVTKLHLCWEASMDRWVTRDQPSWAPAVADFPPRLCAAGRINRKHR